VLVFNGIKFDRRAMIVVLNRPTINEHER
jgi:hypothetical protein